MSGATDIAAPYLYVQTASLVQRRSSEPITSIPPPTTPASRLRSAMHLINVNTLELETFLNDVPPYAILSHTWGSPVEELSFRDMKKKSPDISRPIYGMKKLMGCCSQAKKDNFAYVWIDTCCINKESSKELEESINSMFKWYRKAGICYVYLADVPDNRSNATIDTQKDSTVAFSSSRWFTRGWTLQELLAPEDVCFFNCEWEEMGSKSGDLCDDIETVTGIPRRFLLGWEDFHEASVAQRMSWAAMRVTSRIEDIAYCLLGIFDVTMSMIYGEGNRAFLRLQQEIMKNTGDTSILAWGFDSTVAQDDSEGPPPPSTFEEKYSAGALATSPSRFANSGHITRSHGSPSLFSAFDLSDSRLLGVNVCLAEIVSGLQYGVLDCGLGNDDGRVVAIPIHTTALPNTYLRPQGYSPVLVPSSSVSQQTYERIYIQTTPQDLTRKAARRRLWLHTQGLRKIQMKVQDYHPQLEWIRNRVLVADLNVESDSSITHRHVIRFRSQSPEAPPDIICFLDFEIKGDHIAVQRHVMTLSRDTRLEKLINVFAHFRPQALRRHGIIDGNRRFRVVMKHEQVAQDRVIILKLVRAASGTVHDSIDGDRELEQAVLKSDFATMLERENELHSKVQSLSYRMEARLSDLHGLENRLERKEAELKTLVAERNSLAAQVHDEAKEIETLKSESVSILASILEEQRTQQLMRENIEKSLNKYNDQPREGEAQSSNSGVKETISLYGLSGDSVSSTSSNIDKELNASGNMDLSNCLDGAHVGKATFSNNDSATTPKGSLNGPGESAVPNESDELESRTRLLDSAVKEGNENMVKKLINRGVSLKAIDTPALITASKIGNTSIARFLIDAGANIEAQHQNGVTALHVASNGGHESIVRLLIAAGANIEAQGHNGMTALHAASDRGHESTVKLLIDAGANIEAQYDGGITALYEACSLGHESIARLLIEAGATTEALTHKKYTALHIAASCGQESIARLLIQVGVSINAGDVDGYTPLMFAAMNNHKGMVKILLDHGAHINTKTCDGHTVKSLADSSEVKDLLDLEIIRLWVSQTPTSTA